MLKVYKFSFGDLASLSDFPVKNHVGTAIRRAHFIKSFIPFI